MKLKLVGKFKTSVEGLNLFMDRIIKKHPEIEPFKDELFEFVENSGCKKIEFAGFETGKLPMKGISLTNGLLITADILNDTKEGLMFIFFHEIGHQYQYKLYGQKRMYEAYLGQLPIKEAVEFVKKMEKEADEFATKKCLEYVKKGLLDLNKIDRGVYHKYSDSVFEMQITAMQKLTRMIGTKDLDKLSAIVYKIVKSGVNIFSGFNKLKDTLL